MLPVINETFSLTKTIQILEDTCRSDVEEYLIIVSREKTLPESIEVCERLKRQFSDKVKVIYQKLPFLGGACIDGIAQARGSHLVLMASDLETDPYQVQKMIALSKKNPGHIILNSRWIKGGGFEDYDTLKLFLNFLFQKFFGLIFSFATTDFTYAFRISPTQLMQAIKWEELRHPFLLESLAKPLRLKAKVIQIPSVWRPREEGASQNTFVGNFPYFWVGIRIRFMSPKSVVKPEFRKYV